MPHLTNMVWSYKDELVSVENGSFTSFYNYDFEGNRTRKVVVKNNIREERYYIGGYEVYRKYLNNNLDLERKTINIYDVKLFDKNNDDNEDKENKSYSIDKNKKFAIVDIKTVENGTTLPNPSTIIRYQYDNHLGSACLVLDELGAIISYEEYHPFGTTSYRSGRSETEVSLKLYKYCGKERDEETGLYYYGARYYTGWIGRWISTDPLKEKYLNLSPYNYCANNPVMFVDPDGRCLVFPQPSFGIGLSYGTGGFKANFNFTIDQKVGNFTGSYGLGVTYHSNFFSTGKSGFEFRNSFMLNYDDGKMGVSFGTNIWSGTGGMKEFGQRTGMLSIRIGGLNFSYENDGTPFQWLGLGDGGDSYRTAAASVGIGGFSLNMNLVTGLRNKSSFSDEDAKDLIEGFKGGTPQGRGAFGENYKHGFVIEQGTKYRYGGLTLNYGGISAGVNSEWIRHAFQNVFAHGFLQPQRQFPMLSNDWKPVMNMSNQGTSKFTTWGQ